MPSLAIITNNQSLSLSVSQSLNPSIPHSLNSPHFLARKFSSKYTMASSNTSTKK